ncbi:hypothetical protein Tco_0871270 [Tanacetum coccineum]
MTSSGGVSKGQEREVTRNPQLEPLVRRRMRELRLRGVMTRFKYSSEYVDEEMLMEGPPGFQSQPQAVMKNQNMQNIPSLLEIHLKETE